MTVQSLVFRAVYVLFSFDVNMSIIVQFSLIVPCLEEFMLLVASQVNYLKECTITACTLLIFY